MGGATSTADAWPGSRACCARRHNGGRRRAPAAHAALAVRWRERGAAQEAAHAGGRGGSAGADLLRLRVRRPTRRHAAVTRRGDPPRCWWPGGCL